MLITEDKFDSSILGKRVFKFYLNKTVFYIPMQDIQKKYHPDMLVCFSRHINDNISALRKADFELISIRNTYSLTKIRSNKCCLFDKNLILKSIKEVDDNLSIKKLQELNEQLSLESRYAKDIEISNNIARAIYHIWIENSVLYGFSDQIFSVWDDQNIAGLITLKKRDNVGYIDLLVIDQDYRGKGLARNLVQNAINYFVKLNINTLNVETEGENIRANRFYQRFGFILSDLYLVYHWHKR